MIRDIQIKEFSQYITIHQHSNILHITNNLFFDSSTISGIFGDNYESKATNQIFLPLPTSCVFADGDSPLDEYDCIPICNNEETGGMDNIFFNLTVNENIYYFECVLQENGVIVNSSDCLMNNNNAQEQYTDLPDGNYTFQIIATKLANTTADTNIDALETRIETVPFNFHVGRGEGYGVGILELEDMSMFK
jgi:hypothetical protein